MSEVERFVDHVLSRIEDGAEEEPDFEQKGKYPTGTEAQTLWEIADLVAALSNDVVPGYRALVYGPGPSLTRPAWLTDPAVLADKLPRHFEGHVLPRIELLQRATAHGTADLLVILDRAELPYVTRIEPNGVWVVRIRRGTRRMTATRAELLALCGRRPTGAAVRRIEVRTAPHGNNSKRLVVTNVGTVAVREVRLSMPEGVSCSVVEVDADGLLVDELLPGESVTKLMAMFTGGGPDSFRLEVSGVCEDGEPISATHRMTVYG